jgi:hypothetical protein
MFNDDLAAMVPTAPQQDRQPAKAPAPALPGGVFGHITAQLAGSVVPHEFWGLDVGTTRLWLGLIILGLLLSGVVSLGLSFGSSLRRSGYAHAARSDVAAAWFVFPFATSLRLGYVSAFMPSHSPFLMMSETKTVLQIVPNAFRKEEIR